MVASFDERALVMGQIRKAEMTLSRQRSSVAETEKLLEFLQSKLIEVSGAPGKSVPK